MCPGTKSNENYRPGTRECFPIPLVTADGRDAEIFMRPYRLSESIIIPVEIINFMGGGANAVKIKAAVGFNHLDYPQDERRVLEVVLEGEVDLADVLRGLRVVDVHVHQRNRAVLEEGHLKQKR